LEVYVKFQPLVLAVDDQPEMLRLIKLGLTPQMRVVTAANGTDALRLAEQRRPDIAVLDWLMDDMDGLQLMDELQERRQIPVIMLTAKGSEQEKVQALATGADDYVTKPFRLEELAARIRAILRRADLGGHHTTRVVAQEIEIDLQRRLVRRGGVTVELCRVEWLVLQSLARKPGTILSAGQLLSDIWGCEFRAHSEYLRVWISRLRRKLEADPARPEIISTHPGIGYVFNALAARNGGPAGAEA
jgi:two-component system KDP operon response regulator KdpE